MRLVEMHPYRGLLVIQSAKVEHDMNMNMNDTHPHVPRGAPRLEPPLDYNSAALRMISS